MAHCAIAVEWAVGDSFAPRMFPGRIFGPLAKSKVLKDEAHWDGIPQLRKAL